MDRGLEQEMRWEAVSPVSSWSIPPIRAASLYFPSPFVEHSPSLPTPEELYGRNDTAPEAFQKAMRKELRQESMDFPVAWPASVREKRFNVAWKSFESEPFRCYASLAGSTGFSLASERKIYSSG